MLLISHICFDSELFITFLAGLFLRAVGRKLILLLIFPVLRSRLRIEVRPTENDLTQLYKNGDISVVITCS